MTTGCEGCHSYNKESPMCQAGVIQEVREYLCPCLDCLIKMVCVKPCEPFKKYVDMCKVGEPIKEK